VSQQDTSKQSLAQQDEQKESSGLVGSGPLLSVVCELDHVQTRGLTLMLIRHLLHHSRIYVTQFSSSSHSGSSQPATASLTTTSMQFPLSRRLAMWLYALFARLDKPIDDNVAHFMRTAYRSLASLRTKAEPKSESLIFCNILLTIVGRVFNQKA